MQSENNRHIKPIENERRLANINAKSKLKYRKESQRKSGTLETKIAKFDDEMSKKGS